MSKKLIALLVVIVMLIPTLSGCVPVTVRGGGWLPANGELPNVAEGVSIMDKANFGFTVKCYNTEYDEVEEEWTYDVKGNLLYNDHANGIRIKGKVLEAGYIEDGGVFEGEYTIDGTTGTFTVGVFDGAEPEEDLFGISITGGLYDGYENFGPICGGNIQIFE